MLTERVRESLPCDWGKETFPFLEGQNLETLTSRYPVLTPRILTSMCLKCNGVMGHNRSLHCDCICLNVFCRNSIWSEEKRRGRDCVLQVMWNHGLLCSSVTWRPQVQGKPKRAEYIFFILFARWMGSIFLMALLLVFIFHYFFKVNNLGSGKPRLK
jgi:hypothetical protein